jgi:hypothetical protein
MPLTTQSAAHLVEMDGHTPHLNSLLELSGGTRHVRSLMVGVKLMWQRSKPVSPKYPCNCGK